MRTLPKRIRLLLADDHPLVREGIRSCLARFPNLLVLGEARNGLEAVALSKSLLPDIVLMDINMPELNGLEATRRLRREVPKVKVLALTVHDDKEYVLQIVKSGARGYLLKDAPPDELFRAIQAVHEGKTSFSPRVIPHVLDDYVERIDESLNKPSGPLSIRERDVLTLLTDGFSNKEIAHRLGIGVRTVETHRERIMQKLSIRTVPGLTKYAITNHLTSAP